MKIYSIGQITRYIKAVLEEDVILTDICLEGELSNVKQHSSGHLYFTLKDDAAAISCIMFRNHASVCAFTPADGVKVVAFGRVSVFERAGSYQLYVTMLRPSGIGELYLAYEQLKAGLARLGYFDAQRKRALPAFPGVVGLVTSPDGAAVADMLSVLRRRMPGVKILIAPVKVQGEGAALSIAAGLELLERQGEAEVIIVGRGGGSFEDLWAFNEEAVARAVYECAVPVVSAVGHETDFTICDLVADLRAPTPSAAAELVVRDARGVLETVCADVAQMSDALAQKLNVLQGRLAALANARVLRHPMERIYNSEMHAETLLKRMGAEAARRVASLRGGLEHNTALLESLSPLNTVRRGYAIAYKGGAAVNSAAALAAGDELDLAFADGSALCKVMSVSGETQHIMTGRRKIDYAEKVCRVSGQVSDRAGVAAAGGHCGQDGGSGHRA
ncbi:MAG: exodeoxyribonuclease VII large subunit [Defluviitaleaceae bacterium]|nr:exodeoxyribonuclease VII large subunit [Defluviitaleaceae bacterium]